MRKLHIIPGLLALSFALSLAAQDHPIIIGAEHAGQVLRIDVSSGDEVANLVPAGTVEPMTEIVITKTDNSPRRVILRPFAGTINGGAQVVLRRQHDSVRICADGGDPGNWIAWIVRAKKSGARAMAEAGE
jgi:hypothetical protein